MYASGDGAPTLIEVGVALFWFNFNRSIVASHALSVPTRHRILPHCRRELKFNVTILLYLLVLVREEVPSIQLTEDTSEAPSDTGDGVVAWVLLEPSSQDHEEYIGHMPCYISMLI